MDGLTWTLYLSSFVYYLVVFVCPFILVEECGGGLNPTSHFIYLAYSLWAVLIEVYYVLKIQNKVKNANIL